MRLFTAFELNAPARAAWQQAQASLRGVVSCERWSPAAQAHLTIHFLAEQPVDRLESLCAALRQASALLAPVDLAFDKMGTFDQHVAWIGIAGDLAGLRSLEQSHREALTGIGIQLEQRAYTPHLTLARGLKDGKAGREAMASIVVPTCRWLAEEVVLFNSALGSTGAVHEVIERFPLSAHKSARTNL